MSDAPFVMPGVTPHLTIADGRAGEAIAFYATAFGATEQSRHMADDGVRIMHAHLIVNDGGLMLNDHFHEMSHGEAVPPPAGVTLHLEVDDADTWWTRALDAGATIRFPLDNQFWGARYGQVIDPFGHIWSIGGPVKD
ncbi:MULTISPECIES: VOC family protein [Sphingomonadaceae]|uniref:Glyoxalase/bleomycin resistance protein n=1 Tax=Sphingomonas bisphenolicum TaxID=296544 RepID=A0ABM7FZU9_9SPHN|nr:MULTISPECIES: VOC family protein [Sphingomonadaceae]MBZ9646442.1 VOC family protein [Sphingobium sp. 3R8]BBF68491.1 putative glyoxalase/bleomycin resistance protein [Sphingomonas bisphenolicum]